MTYNERIQENSETPQTQANEIILPERNFIKNGMKKTFKSRLQLQIITVHVSNKDVVKILRENRNRSLHVVSRKQEIHADQDNRKILTRYDT